MSALRNLRQLTSVSSRALSRSAVAPRATRSAAAAFTCRVAAPAGARAFSLSVRRCGEGASDVALSQKLAEELKYEKDEAAAAPGEPEFLKAFKAQGVWTIEDASGNDEVTLTRKFGNETIRLMFSIADVNNSPEEEFDPMEGEEPAVDEDEPVHAAPVRASFSITKSTAEGSLNIDTVCQDGAFLVDNISFYPTSVLGTELTAEADWRRRGLYLGPQFDTLDVGVQEEVERFLAERGIAEPLALFIPEYSEFKEQKEYVRWLKNVKGFVDA